MLAVQLLTSAGAKVIGIDIDEARLERGESLGAIPVDARDEAMIAGTCRAHTAGIGVDGVLVTASACDDNVLRHAAAMCRKRGRIVLVGAVDMELDRSDFYEKELSFQVSCSYGPGRYDAGYEQAGIDYPLPYVRWTEQRNIAAVVDLIASGKVDPTLLTTCRLPQQDARRAYDLLSRDRSHVAIVLEYPKERAVRDLRIVNVSQPESSAVGRPVVGVIGAGQFAKRTLVPALQATGARLKSIASAAGLNAATLAKKFSCESATSDHGTILADDEINAVVIATPHHLHAPLAAAALDAGKHVFVEKPLAIDREGLVSVRRAYEAAGDLQLLVGFNRRFSSLAGQAKKLLAARSRPATAIVTVNAGQLPPEHWLHDPRIGGGRVVGEACHWIDLLCHLLDGKVVCVHAAAARESPSCDQAILTLTFDDGSLATLNYLSGGHRSYSKERIEVFTQGRVLVLDNFRRLTGYGWPSFRRRRLLWQDKGHREELRQFIDRIAQGGPPLIPPAQLWNVADATLAAAEALRSNVGSTIPVAVD